MNLSIRRYLAAILVAVVALPPGTAARAQRRPEVGCRACIVVADDGRVLFARAPDRPLPNASTTKMVTALVVRRELTLDERVRVSATAAAAGGGTLDLRDGEAYSVRDLLAAMLMASSNDAAVALAEHVAGSEPAFVAAMNRFVATLGLRRTHFVTSHGLDRPGHFASARDLVAIARRMLADPVLRAIVGRRRTTIVGPRGRLAIDNRNVLLETYRGAFGVKTGYTLGANNVLVAAARRHGRTLIAVVMGSEDSFEDARRLLDRGFARLRNTRLVRAGVPVAALVLDGHGSVPVVAAEPVRGATPAARVRLVFDADDDLRSPLSPGDRVGTVRVMAGDRVVATTEAVADDAVADPRSGWATDLLAGILGVFGRALGAAA